MSAGAWCSFEQTWVRKCTEHRDPSKRLVKRLLFSGPWIRERIKGSGPAPFRAHGDMCVTGIRTWNKQVKKCIWGNRVTNRDEKQTTFRLPWEELLVSLPPRIYMYAPTHKHS
jgi:hypothetical protein